MTKQKRIGVRIIRCIKKAVATYGKRRILDLVNLEGSKYKICPNCVKEGREAPQHESKFYVRKNGHLSGWCMLCSCKYERRQRRLLRNI